MSSCRKKPSKKAIQSTLNNPCPRPYPTAALKLGKGVHHTFEITTNHEAIEVADLGEGMKIEIRHRGCGYYILNYRITAPHQQLPNDDIAYWYVYVSDVISRLKPIDESPIALKLASRALREAISVHKSSLRYGLKIEYFPKEPKEYVRIDTVQVQGNTRIIEWEFGIGPL